MDYETFAVGEFALENGGVRPEAKLAYQTYGQLNSTKTNAILLCSAFTGNHTFYEYLIQPGRCSQTLTAHNCPYTTGGPRRRRLSVMPLFSSSLDKPPLQKMAGGSPSPIVCSIAVPGLAFLMLCLLVALDATSVLDRWGLSMRLLGVSPVLDGGAFLITLLGEPQLTGALSVVMAVWGWQRRGVQGLVPLLLFVGVAIEVVLKYVLPHPGPPPEFSHSLHLPLVLHLVTPFLLHLDTPYSFPSGHMLRTTFLVSLITQQLPRWRLAGWMLIGAMALTRVYLNDHWLSDVGGGVLLGLTLAAVAAEIERESAVAPVADSAADGDS